MFETHKMLFNLKEEVGVRNVVELTCVICKPKPSPIMTSLGPQYLELNDKFTISFMI